MAQPCRNYLASIAYTFYKYAQQHKIVTVLCLFSVWLVLLFSISTMRVDKSSIAFFPDSSPTMQSMARAMDLAPFSRFLCLDIAYKDAVPNNSEALVAAAKQLQKAIPENLAAPISTDIAIQPEALLALLPSLFDASMEQRVAARVEKHFVAEAVQKAYSIFAGFSVASATAWLRTDPLALRDFIMPYLPAPSALPLPDPRYALPMSADGKHVLLLFRPLGSMHDTEFSVALMSAFEHAARALPDTMQITLVGGARHTAANARAIDADIRYVAFFSLFGLAFIYIFFVRSIGAFWLFLTPCFAVTAALGLMNFFYISLSGLALGFGSAVLGIAEDYAIHVHFALRSNNKRDAVFDALSKPLLQSLLLNASGFALMLFSSIPAVRQLSAFALCSLFFGFLIALFILPLCPAIDKPFQPSAMPPRTMRFYPILWKTMGLAVALCCACAALFMAIAIDVSPRSMGANMASLHKDAQTFFGIWGKAQGAMLAIEAQNIPAALHKAEQVAHALRLAQPDMRLNTLTDILPSPAQSQQNRERWQQFVHKHALPLQKEMEASASLLGLGHAAFDPFFAWLYAEPEKVTVEFLQNSVFSGLTASFVRDFPQAQRSQALLLADRPIDITALPKALREACVLISPEALEQGLHEIFIKETRYLPCALGLCLLLLFWCFWRWDQALLASISALTALFCILFVLYVTGRPLTLAAVAAMPLVMGLAVDHGVMVTHAMAEGFDLGIERAVLVSSCSACVGMGLLAFAEHPALQDMGRVIFLGLAVELPASLWLLPLLCAGEEKE